MIWDYSDDYGSNVARSGWRGPKTMEKSYFRFIGTYAAVLLLSALLGAQGTYQPKFHGDPAKSDSEAAALGYMRTVLRAQKLYKKKNDRYATSLAELVHTG